jgi:hypothetical protein
LAQHTPAQHPRPSAPDGGPVPPLPFAEVTEPGYAERHTRGLRVAGTRSEAVLTGSCPRCGHVFQFVHPWRSYRSPRRRPDGLHPVQVVCTCEGEHPGRPADEEGCGAYWLLYLRRSRG